MIRKPNFFIVGAPKCGTTSLSVYLGQHPNVFFCSPKEPYYFATDFPVHRRVSNASNLADYLSLFSNARAEHLAIGEGSAGYMYSTAAIPGIMKFNERAKLIVMLRNPIDLAYSYHGQALFDGVETEEDFATAWNLQAEREKGRRVPRACYEVKALLYKRLASIGGQLECLYKLVPREQVKVIMLDELIASPRMVYDGVCEFLDIPSDARTEFPRINEAKRHRFRMLGALCRPPQFMVRGLQVFKRACGIQRLGLLNAIARANVIKGSRPPLTPELRAQLVEEFSGDIDTLSSVLHRDFSMWLKCERRAA